MPTPILRHLVISFFILCGCIFLIFGLFHGSSYAYSLTLQYTNLPDGIDGNTTGHNTDDILIKINKNNDKERRVWSLMHEVLHVLRMRKLSIVEKKTFHKYYSQYYRGGCYTQYGETTDSECFSELGYAIIANKISPRKDPLYLYTRYLILKNSDKYKNILLKLMPQ